MTNDASHLKHHEITARIIAVFYDVYNELGHGFLESVYHNAMLLALRQAGMKADSKWKLKVWFRGNIVGEFEPDIAVDEVVIVELKAIRNLDPAHEAKLLNYLRATDVEVGLLLNFGDKPQFKRLVFDNERKAKRPTNDKNQDFLATDRTDERGSIQET